MGDYRWLTAVVSEVCAMCGETIKQGDGFYFEASKRKPHCRDCGRCIRRHGEEKARSLRSSIFGAFNKIFGGGGL